VIHTGDFQVRNFGLNLRRIRKEEGLSQDALARRLGTFKQVISRYENAERIPRITDAAKYAEALGVTLSELTEEAPPCSRGSDHPPDNPRAVFTANLKRYAAREGVKQKDIAFALGIPQTTVSDWFTGKKYPRIEAMEQLADCLGVSYEALVCGDAPEQMPEHRDTHTPNDQDHLKGANIMITLNDLLALAEVKRVTIYVPATPRVYTRVDFDPQDGAILDDVTKLYGHLRVKTIGPIYKGDERLVVKLTDEGLGAPNDQDPSERSEHHGYQ